MDSKDVEFVLPVEREDLKHDKKSKISKNKIILFIAVGLVVVILFVVFAFLLPDTINGSWELTVNPQVKKATADQIDDRERAYYTFEKSNRYGDGKWKTFYDGGVEEGDYKLSEKDGKKFINLGGEDLEYTIEGVKLFGKAKLTLIYPEYVNEETGEKTEAQTYVMEQSKAPKYDKESYDKYSVDDKLIGQWSTNERALSYFYYELPYVETLDFNDDGIMTIRYESEDLMLDRYMYYAYTAEKGKITFSLVTDKETKYTVGYEFDDKGNLKFIDDKTKNSIFSDAFFGDATYYKPEKMPKATPQQVSESVDASK